MDAGSGKVLVAVITPAAAKARSVQVLCNSPRAMQLSGCELSCSETTPPLNCPTLNYPVANYRDTSVNFGIIILLRNFGTNEHILKAAIVLIT